MFGKGEHERTAYRNFAISKSNSRIFFVELGVDDSFRFAARHSSRLSDLKILGFADR
jgi:hypothetical protein